MRILIAEDDAVLGDGLARSLRQAGYAVDLFKDGQQADAALKVESYDLAILDVGLPRISGLVVLERLRGREQAVPVLILTALSGVEDRVRGLDLGADDYLTKPFDLSELEARVRALTRRGMCGAAPLVKLGNLSYDRNSRAAFLDEQPMELSARELALLEVLIQRAGRLVSKDQIVAHLCEWGEEVSDNAVEVYIHRLRKKLEPGEIRITTVRGLGYCLENPAKRA